MNYTKGEWTARKLLPDRHGIISKEAWEITTPEYDVVAQIIGSAPIRKGADAYLIAAAPDMYEACKLGLAKCEAYIHDEYDGVSYIGELLAELEPIRKAVAKAEGKS